MSTSYAVIVGKFAERHYIAKFKKKHKNAWGTTWNAIEEQFRRIENLIGISSMLIAVGYRINSVVGTKFRQWATKTLRPPERVANSSLLVPSAQTTWP